MLFDMKYTLKNGKVLNATQELPCNSIGEVIEKYCNTIDNVLISQQENSAYVFDKRDVALFECKISGKKPLNIEGYKLSEIMDEYFKLKSAKLSIDEVDDGK